MISHGGGSLIDRKSGGGSAIPQLDIDPTSPAAQSAWVLRTGAVGSPNPGKLNAFMGLGFPYIGAAGHSVYQFSYQTIEGTIRRVALS